MRENSSISASHENPLFSCRLRSRLSGLHTAGRQDAATVRGNGVGIVNIKGRLFRLEIAHCDIAVFFAPYVDIKRRMFGLENTGCRTVGAHQKGSALSHALNDLTSLNFIPVAQFQSAAGKLMTDGRSVSGIKVCQILADPCPKYPEYSLFPQRLRQRRN